MTFSTDWTLCGSIFKISTFPAATNGHSGPFMGRKRVGALMPEDAPKTTKGSRIVAGVIAAALCAVFIGALVTGYLPHYRYGHFSKSSDPLFFWAYTGLFAAAAACAALFALGYFRPPPRAAYVAHVRRRTASDFAFLTLLAAAGSGYYWLSKWLENALNPMGEMAGWLALGMLGIAAWPPLLAPGAARTWLRAAGTIAIIVAVTMLSQLAMEKP
ncbi:hypothetical protein [Hyphomicrobium sp. D-2]|uniref:hypothetical protein n=1 Tax=Hyphomicrobium sp. D-2 TaxID=3041621 RepID=UPI002457B3EF|nr:hypothetical protein [Hyphomicrobium sp. D-2]MDH4983953.1 hypothetical protein [Hyphomicrobium sp. D-2]